jgi:hypothetical protein
MIKLTTTNRYQRPQGSGVLQRVASRVTGQRVGATCELDGEREGGEVEEGSSSEEETEEEKQGTL